MNANLIQWLIKNGLLIHHDICTRPNNTIGPAWILRKPYSIDGGSCEEWGESIEDAIQKLNTIEQNQFGDSGHHLGHQTR